MFRSQRQLFCLLLTAGYLVSCATTGSVDPTSSGTFRGKWWNYYDRGMALNGRAEWKKAMPEIRQAISMRAEDQRMARTYGMHFIDYFPHRELGISLLNTGHIPEAIEELETSLRHEESAKAAFYLNRARTIHLRKQTGRSFRPPQIMIDAPSEGAALTGLSIPVSGRVAGEGFVSSISINNRPFRFDLAKESISFSSELAADDGENEITITAQDLLGNVSQKTVSVTIDREGPTISIFDIVAVEKNGQELIGISGEINDRTGIEELLIGGKTIHANGSVAYEFDTTIKRERDGPVFVIHAFDGLGNETRAEFDLERELIAFSAQPEPVLLASAADMLFASDEKPPLIKLKGTADLPEVFVDKYYVEGEVSDNKKVEKLLINDTEVETRKGRKIFFSKVVRLDRGTNNISVSAYDAADNSSASEFTVKRHVPAVFREDSRMSITVLPFESTQLVTPLAQLSYDQLIGSFVEQKRFSVIERTRLEQVLREQKLTTEKLTDPRHSIKVGRLMAAEGILATSIRETETSIEVISRVINTETSEVMEVKDVYSENKSFSTVRELMDGLASKIAQSFPLVEGMVIDRDGSTVYSDIGSVTRVKKDMKAILYREGREIKHPVTGRSLGKDTVTLAEGTIEEIHEDFSKIRIEKGSDSEVIVVRDMIITK